MKLIPRRVLSLQARKPSGLIGRYVMTRIFCAGNADLNCFVKSCLALQPDDKVLEIGFGPGKLISEIADVTTDGLVEGVDYSETMVKQAEVANRQHILSGRVILHQGECSSLPCEDDRFDKVCSINTVYFWGNPSVCIAEMFRVTRPGGTIAIGFRDDQQMSNLNLSKDVFSLFSREDVVDLLSEAGFRNAHIEEKDGAPFVSFCAVATKA